MFSFITNRERTPALPRPSLRIPRMLLLGCWSMLAAAQAVTGVASALPAATLDLWQLSYEKEYAGDAGGALRLLEPMLKEADTRELALLRTGWLLYSRQQYTASASHYLDALRLNALSLEARLGIMLNLMAQKRWSEAMRYGQQVLAQSDNYIAQSRMLVCEEALRDWGALRQRAQKLVSRYPSDPDAWIYLARAHAWLGHEKDSQRAYRQVLRLVPGNQEARVALNLVQKTP